MRCTSAFACVLAFLACVAASAQTQAPAAPAAGAAVPIPLPGGERGIGFDDLRFAKSLGLVVAPAGGTGNLDLVDPASGAVTPIKGFAPDSFAGGHGEGTTSADEGAGFLFAIDRTSTRVVVIDPKAKEIVSGAELIADADYVRFVAPTRELWVTEPDAQSTQVFKLPDGEKPVPQAVTSIPVPGGPESLIVDATRGRAYTHLWDGVTVALDLKSRAIVGRWKNGCTGSRGIALDEPRGWLFVGCAEGSAAVLDVGHDGAVLGSVATGKGVDIVDYDAGRGHLYVPARDGTLSVLGVSAKGALSVLGALPIAKEAQGVTSDGKGNVFVGDPKGGRLLKLVDPYPAQAR